MQSGMFFPPLCLCFSLLSLSHIVNPTIFSFFRLHSFLFTISSISFIQKLGDGYTKPVFYKFICYNYTYTDPVTGVNETRFNSSVSINFFTDNTCMHTVATEEVYLNKCLPVEGKPTQSQKWYVTGLPTVFPSLHCRCFIAISFEFCIHLVSLLCFRLFPTNSLFSF